VLHHRALAGAAVAEVPGVGKRIGVRVAGIAAVEDDGPRRRVPRDGRARRRCPVAGRVDQLKDPVAADVDVDDVTVRRERERDGTADVGSEPVCLRRPDELATAVVAQGVETPRRVVTEEVRPLVLGRVRRAGVDDAPVTLVPCGPCG
jgi:hypothetical protein